MKATGERITLSKVDKLELPIIYQEHWARYQFIKPHIKNKVVLDAGCGSDMVLFI